MYLMGRWDFFIQGLFFHPSGFFHPRQWRNPELTLTTLCQQVCSNRTYVCEAFKRNTGFTFSEYMAQKRIGYVVSVLKENSNTNIKDLFHYVGYRSRTAGWENFHKVTGASPSEFVANLKKANKVLKNPNG